MGCCELGWLGCKYCFESGSRRGFGLGLVMLRGSMWIFASLMRVTGRGEGVVGLDWGRSMGNVFVYMYIRFFGAGTE